MAVEALGPHVHDLPAGAARARRQEAALGEHPHGPLPVLGGPSRMDPAAAGQGLHARAVEDARLDLVLRREVEGEEEAGRLQVLGPALAEEGGSGVDPGELELPGPPRPVAAEARRAEARDEFAERREERRVVEAREEEEPPEDAGPPPGEPERALGGHSPDAPLDDVVPLEPHAAALGEGLEPVLG